MRKALTDLAAGQSDEERNERVALLAFYEAHGYTPLWLTPQGVTTPKANAVSAEIGRASEWGLAVTDFPLPSVDAVSPKAETIAPNEIAISQAVLKYGRYARGGRIINPSEQLSSYLDRRPSSETGSDPRRHFHSGRCGRLPPRPQSSSIRNSKSCARNGPPLAQKAGQR